MNIFTKQSNLIFHKIITRSAQLTDNILSVTAKGTGPQDRTGPESPSTGGPVGHPPPNPATLCDRSAQEVNRDTQGHLQKYSDIGLVTISFPACCVSHRATGLPVMVHDMHTRRTRPDYLQACPIGPPVDGVKSALTPALWPCTFCSDPYGGCGYKFTS